MLSTPKSATQIPRVSLQNGGEPVSTLQNWGFHRRECLHPSKEASPRPKNLLCLSGAPEGPSPAASPPSVSPSACPSAWLKSPERAQILSRSLHPPPRQLKTVKARSLGPGHNRSSGCVTCAHRKPPSSPRERLCQLLSPPVRSWTTCPGRMPETPVGVRTADTPRPPPASSALIPSAAGAGGLQPGKVSTSGDMGTTSKSRHLSHRTPPGQKQAGT